MGDFAEHPSAKQHAMRCFSYLDYAKRKAGIWWSVVRPFSLVYNPERLGLTFKPHFLDDLAAFIKSK